MIALKKINKTVLKVIGGIVVILLTTMLSSNASEKGEVVANEVNNQIYIYDSVIYQEGWHNLPQTKFWQVVMSLTPDTGVFNIADTREMLEKVSIKSWDALSEKEQELYREKIRDKYCVPENSRMFITTGKKDFYNFGKVMPNIETSIPIFKYNCVDPWYAQAILLIESPGKMNEKSINGANGPFQLMRSVARNQGLIVNNYKDERTDIKKAALGASRLLSSICIPKVKEMLGNAKVEYKEDDLWFRLLVLHVYHAGAGNVGGVIRKINPTEGGMELLQTVWKTTYKGFKNSSQNYSQVAIAAFCNYNKLMLSQ